MNKVLDVSNEDKELMVRYNIRAETKSVFYYESYKYDNLKDAIRYAMLEMDRMKASGDE